MWVSLSMVKILDNISFTLNKDDKSRIYANNDITTTTLFKVIMVKSRHMQVLCVGVWQLAKRIYQRYYQRIR